MIRLGGLMLLLLFVHRAGPHRAKSTARYDKSADFQTLKTYSWMPGQPAFDPAVDKTIVAAVDSEMSALGLKKAAGKPADVTIRYLAVRSTSIDLDKLEEIEKQGGDKAGADVHRGTARHRHAGRCKVRQTAVGCGLRRAAQSRRRRA